MFFLSLRYLLTHSMPSPVLQSNEDSCVLKETSCDVDSEVCGNRRPGAGAPNLALRVETGIKKW